MNVDKNARSRLAVESGQTVGTLRMRVEGYDDQGSRNCLSIFRPHSRLRRGGVWVDLTTYVCAETSRRLTPHARARRTNIVRFTLNAFADYQHAIP
jgi:hypothetical protein